MYSGVLSYSENNIAKHFLELLQMDATGEGLQHPPHPLDMALASLVSQ